MEGITATAEVLRAVEKEVDLVRAEAVAQIERADRGIERVARGGDIAPGGEREALGDFVGLGAELPMIAAIRGSGVGIVHIDIAVVARAAGVAILETRAAVVIGPLAIVFLGGIRNGNADDLARILKIRIVNKRVNQSRPESLEAQIDAVVF